MSDNELYLGIVKEGLLAILIPESEAGTIARLTTIFMADQRPPESGEINLKEHEGKAIMVNGHYGGDWIYSANIIDQASPILSAMVKKIFGV
jgi:hypothetical protein